MLHEHRVLTATTHITQLAFGTTRAATARMLTLHRHQLADRFRPLAAAGSAPWHFVLGPAGAMSSPPSTRSRQASWSTAATAPSRSPCPPGSATTRAPAASSPPRRPCPHRRERAPGLLVVRAAVRRPVGRPGPARRHGRAADALAARFAADYLTRPPGEAPAGWLPRLAPMVTSQLYGTLARTAATPALWPPGQPPAAASLAAVRIRDLAAGSVILTVTARVRQAAGAATTTTLAVTIVQGAAGWAVYDVEPANSGNAG
jgi:Replication-relaxation